MVRQQRQQLGRGEKSGADAFGEQLFHQLCKHAVPQCARFQHIGQRHHIRALIVIGHGAVSVHKGFFVGCAGLLQLVRIAGLVLRPVQMPGRPYHDTQIVDDEGIGHRSIVHRHKLDVPAGCQPVAQIGGQPQILFSHVADLTFHQRFHAVILFLQRGIVTVLPVKLFRHNGVTVGPAQHIDESHPGRPLRGDGGGHITLGVFPLRIADVLEEFAPERLGIIVVHTGAGIDLPITGVALPFIPLGAVGGDLHIIGALAPKLVDVQPFHLFVVTGEPAGALHVGMHRVGGHKAGKVIAARQLHIAESHIGEGWPVFFTGAALMVGDGGLGGTQIVGVQAAVPVQALAMAHRQRVAAHQGWVDFNDAREVLAEVQNHPVPAAGHALHRHFLLHLHTGVTGFQRFGNFSGEGHRRQDRQARAIGAVILTVIQARGAPGAFHRLHRSVGRGEHFGFGTGFYGQDPTDSGTLTINLGFVVAGKPAAVPALPQRHPQRVSGPGEKFRYIIGLDMQIQRIIGITGGKEVVAHLFAVDARLIHAQRRDGQCGAAGGGDGLLKDLYCALLIGALCCDKTFLQRFHRVPSQMLIQPFCA